MSGPRPSHRLPQLISEGPALSPNATTGDGHSDDRGRRTAPEPTERSEAERAFFEAVQTHRTATGRMFPSWAEVLEVIERLKDREAE